jgi:hypothetical protein
MTYITIASDNAYSVFCSRRMLDHVSFVTGLFNTGCLEATTYKLEPRSTKSGGLKIYRIWKNVNPRPYQRVTRD